MPPQFDSVWTFLRSHATDADRETATAILNTDSSVAHRSLALGVLANFPGSDEAWWALMHALRDPHTEVFNPSFVAQEVIEGWMNSGEGRPVAWRSRVDDVRALLAGANLWMFPTVMRVLTVTKVDPSLAPALLRDNATFVLGFAESRDPTAATIGRELLMQLSGKNYGADSAKWRDWVKTL